MTSVGVPASAPVAGVKVTPGGRVPDWVKVGAGVPEAATVKVPEVPTVKVVEVALVKAGAMMRLRVNVANIPSVTGAAKQLVPGTVVSIEVESKSIRYETSVAFASEEISNVTKT